MPDGGLAGAAWGMLSVFGGYGLFTGQGQHID